LKLFIKQRAFDNQTPITPEIMVRIVEEEAEAAAVQKKASSSQTTESEIPADDDDDYDNLVSYSLIYRN
jgi:hypothetical protein